MELSEIDIDEVNTSTFLSDRIRSAITAADRPLTLEEQSGLIDWRREEINITVRSMVKRRKLKTFDHGGEIYYGLPAMEMPAEWAA